MPPPLCSRHGFLRPTSTTPLGLAPPRQARIHRHRVRMTTTPEPGRLPSIRPRPCGRSGPDCAHFYTCTFQPRTLSLAAIRPGPVKRHGGRFKLLLATTQALRPAPSLPEKMRLTDVCNRLTTRAPCEPFDSRLRLRRPCGSLRALNPRREPRVTWVEHRLTATLQLRLSTLIVSRRDTRVLPRAWRERDTARSWRVPRSTAPPAVSLGRGVFDRDPSWRRSL
jgi:hypothetical protein